MIGSITSRLGRRSYLLKLANIRKAPALCYGSYGSEVSPNENNLWPIKVDIGTREVVGFGVTGDATYIDDWHYPFPAIRFKEDKGEIIVSGLKFDSDLKVLIIYFLNSHAEKKRRETGVK